jgi:adenosylcobyric acid synthase
MKTPIPALPPAGSPPDFAPHLAVLGTASDVGKSSLCVALCRLLHNAGFRVQPFKAQNMSNNSYVAADGGEIGRAQYLQALAARVLPSVHHNPVLLKPAADDSSQVVVHGQAIGKRRAAEYFGQTGTLRAVAFESLQALMAQADVVVLEGAGSCAEVNLRDREFVNFPVAHHARARAILVADIDRGGVFAQLIGSLDVMPDEDRQRVAGLIINKFRGDRALFDDGVSWIERRTGLPVLGVVPYVYGLDLDAEDAVPLSAVVDPAPGADPEKLKIAVVRLPHVSNFTDFDALARVPGVAVHYLYRARDLSEYAAVVLPGSKSVVGDLQWLRATGVAEQVSAYSRRGGKLFGICGGFQMLGTELLDDVGVESEVRRAPGLGLLAVRTVFGMNKVVRRTAGAMLDCPGEEEVAVAGYEIHHGQTDIGGCTPLLLLEGAEFDGVRDDERRIWATYLHGVFDEAPFRNAFLRWLDPSWQEPRVDPSRLVWLDAEIERFAKHVRAHLDWPTIEHWVKAPG